MLNMVLQCYSNAEVYLNMFHWIIVDLYNRMVPVLVLTIKQHPTSQVYLNEPKLNTIKPNRYLNIFF